MHERSRSIAAAQLDKYRAESFRFDPARRVRTPEEARTFVNERGFVYFWPINGIRFPSLWGAVAGDRPVASAHGDPGHVTWGWKDDALDKRHWYYAKVLRGKATLISLDVAPAFYALSENFGTPEEDYLELYRAGLLSQAGKAIFEALLNEGPLDTVNLRRVIRMTGKSSNSPFDRGLVELQRDFKILPVGVARSGAWRYSFIYDCVHRFYPELSERARAYSREEARRVLVRLFMQAVGAAQERELRRLFQWAPREIAATLNDLCEVGEVVAGCRHEEGQEEWFALPSLLA